MKKTFVLILILMSTQVYSQVTFKPGIKAGINSSTIMNLSNGYRTGIYVGILGELKFGNQYAMLPEIIYSMQGSEDVELNYLTLGLGHKFYLGKLNLYIIAASGIDVYLGGLQSFSDEYDAEANVDATISFGLGYSLPIGLDLEVRYKQGLIDLEYHESYLIELPATGNLNSVFQIGVSYKFDFKNNNK